MNSFQVDHYSMPFVENGTSYSEQIEVDENGGVVIFRVPDHNDVDAADFYNDFKMVCLLLLILFITWSGKSKDSGDTSVFKMFSVHTKTESRRFKLLRSVEERFRKAPLS